MGKVLFTSVVGRVIKIQSIFRMFLCKRRYKQGKKQRHIIMKNNSSSTNGSLSTNRSSTLKTMRTGSVSPGRRYETEFSVVELQKMTKLREHLVETENDPFLKGYYSRQNFLNCRRNYLKGVEEEKSQRDFPKVQFRMLHRYLHTTYGKRSDSDSKSNPKKVDSSEVGDVPDIDIGKKPVNYKFAQPKKGKSNLPNYDDELDRFINDCKQSPEKLPPANPDDSPEDEVAKASKEKDINLLLDEDPLKQISWDSNLESEFRRQMTTSKDSHKRGKHNIMLTFISSEIFRNLSGESLIGTISCPSSMKIDYINARRQKRADMMMKARDTYLEETQYQIMESRKRTNTSSPQQRQITSRPSQLSSRGRSVISPNKGRYCKTFQSLS